MSSGKQIKKKKSHIKASKSKKKSSKHSKKNRKVESGLFKKSNKCKQCENSTHNKLECPRIWRTYNLKENLKKDNISILPIHTIYCYKCGERGHFGDDCVKHTSARQLLIEPSAFSGGNLEAPLSKIYYKTIRRQREDDEKFEGKHSSYKSLKMFHFYKPPYVNEN